MSETLFSTKYKVFSKSIETEDVFIKAEMFSTKYKVFSKSIETEDVFIKTEMNHE